jgi:hypothetical protein
MRISIMPKSILGWWSVGLVIASFVLFLLFDVIIGPGPDYNMALAYALTTVIAAISLVVFAASLLGIVKNKERSILVFMAIVIGLYSFIGCITGLLGLQK